MSYSEEKRQIACPSCSKLNHIIIAYAGDYRANERETADCFACGQAVDQEECFAIFTGDTAKTAELRLRRMQNRA